MPNAIHGSEFRLTTKAREYLADVIADLQTRPGFESHFVVFSWVNGDALHGDDFIPGPAVAADNRRDMFETEHYYLVGDQKAYIPFDGKRLQEFRDKVLDYRAKRLVLVWGDDLFI